MRVICIHNGYIKTEDTGLILNAPELKEGEAYTVISDTPKGLAYILAEIKSKKAMGYSKRRFIPLSEIDEMELVTSNKETA